MSYGKKLLKLRYIKIQRLKITKLFWTTFKRRVTRNSGWEVNSVNHLFCFYPRMLHWFPLLRESQDLPTRGAAAVQHFSIMEIFTNTRQAPWFTRWMNRLKNSHFTRPCKLEVHMALSTFLSLINISLLWLNFGMVRTNLTLYSLPVEWTAVCGISEITNKRSCTLQVLHIK